MEIERDTLRNIIDLAITKCFEVGDIDAEKYTDFINILLRFDNKIKTDKIVIIGIKD